MRMNRTHLLLATPALLLLAAAVPALKSQGGVPTYKRSTLVSVSGGVEVKAPIAQVWTAVVSPKGLSALTGFRIAATGKGLSKVGDATTATNKTDKGNLVCTHVIDGKELRVAFEPDSGSYVCQYRIALEPLAGGPTQLSVTDRYSDEQTDTVDRTAKEAVAELARRIPVFQEMAEKP